MQTPSATSLESAPIAPAIASATVSQGPKILILDPDSARRRQVARGLAALGYSADAFASVDDLPPENDGPWVMVLISPHAGPDEHARLDKRLDSARGAKPAVRSLATVYEDDENSPPAAKSPQTQREAPACAAPNPQSAIPNPQSSDEPWSDDAKIALLRWMADDGPAALRPIPCPAAVLGHAYPRLEGHCGLGPGEAVRILEDLADFGVLSRRLTNRVHLCPNCRRWTVNFRETCPNCSSLDINIEELVHHFACAYVGLDHEYRRGSELHCPKCRARLNHIGVDYERPRQTYVCGGCECLMEDPTLTAQCLDCRWEGGAAEVLAWPVHEYVISERGREAIERGELRGLKLREMIHSGQCALASREFFELEVERETYRYKRYGRAMSILLCRFVVDGLPYSIFHDADRQAMRDFARRVAEEVRSLDVAALADARTIAILMPETTEAQAGEAAARLRGRLDAIEIKSAGGCLVGRKWSSRSWSGPGKKHASAPGAPSSGESNAQDCEALEWFQQQIESRPAGG